MPHPTHGLSLTAREFTPLEYFMLNRGKVLSRADLLLNVWRFQLDPGTNIVDVNNARLRAKLKQLGATDSIYAQRGLGYRLREARRITEEIAAVGTTMSPA